MPLGCSWFGVSAVGPALREVWGWPRKSPAVAGGLPGSRLDPAAIGPQRAAHRDFSGGNSRSSFCAGPAAACDVGRGQVAFVVPCGVCLPTDGECVPGTPALLFPLPGQHPGGRVRHGGRLPAGTARHAAGGCTELMGLVPMYLNHRIVIVGKDL